MGTLEQTRGSFSGKIGFIFAAAGSAVGLGNIWRFPYLAAKYGGGIFLLVYIILAVTFGFTLMLAETALGRKTGLSAIGAFKKLNQKYSFLGYLTALVPLIILPYYCVIGGWVMKYMTVYFTGQGTKAAEPQFYSSFISQPGEPVLWLCLFIALTALVVFFGVEKGVEKASKLMMPVLAVLSVGVTIYSVTRPGALDGVIYYLTPDFSHFSPMTILAALGQLFYSMSLAMGIMITYGSYMKKENDIEKCVKRIELFDTGMAFIAGLMIIPAVFAFSGGSEESLNAGPGLMFETLPKVFASANSLGLVFGAIFFLLVFFAALTSSVSMMETVVSILRDKFHIGRRFTCLLVVAGCALVAVPISLGYSLWDFLLPLGMTLLDFFDFISNSVLMPIVAFCTCLFVGYVLGPKTLAEEVKLSSPFKKEKLFTLVVKYIAPVCIVLILASSVLNAMGIIRI